MNMCARRGAGRWALLYLLHTHVDLVLADASPPRVRSGPYVIARQKPRSAERSKRSRHFCLCEQPSQGRTLTACAGSHDGLVAAIMRFFWQGVQSSQRRARSTYLFSRFGDASMSDAIRTFGSASHPLAPKCRARVIRLQLSVSSERSRPDVTL